MPSNLIVATWHNLIILRDGQVIDNLSEADTGHYGITWNDDYLFALFASSCVLDGTDQVIRVFDHDLQPVRDILLGDIAGVHQIQWHDDLLWICSTNDDSIVVATAEGDVVRRWHPVPDWDPEDPAKDHVNSIWFHDGHVYTVAHGFHHGTPAIYKHTYPGFQLVGTFEGVHNEHNVYIHHGEMITCVPNMLARIGKPPVRIGEHDGMNKGLAVTDDRIYMGSSRIIKERSKRREDLRGRVFTLSHDYDWLDTFELDLGPIGEVRALNEPDYAHHGLPWGGKYGA